MENANNTNSLSFDFFMSKENNSNSDTSKKRKREKNTKDELNSNKKPKLAAFSDSSNEENSLSELNLSIREIADCFIKIIKKDYIITPQHSNSAENSDENDLDLTDDSKFPYKIQAIIKVSLTDTIEIKANRIEEFYQTVAKKLLDGTHSITTLIEYFISQNYNWKEVGKFNESLMHYLITLPNIISALDRFDLDKQRELLEANFDEENNNPLQILAKLYSESLDESYYESLKACFEIIQDFDNDYINYIHLSAESTTDSEESSAVNSSAFYIVIANIEEILNQDILTTDIENYLEILALMFIHSNEYSSNKELITDYFKGKKLEDSYLDLFKKHCIYYKLKDQVLSDAENEQASQNGSVDLDQEDENNSPRFFKKSAPKKAVITNEEEEKNNYQVSSDAVSSKKL